MVHEFYFHGRLAQKSLNLATLTKNSWTSGRTNGISILFLWYTQSMEHQYYSYETYNLWNINSISMEPKCIHRFVRVSECASCNKIYSLLCKVHLGVWCKHYFHLCTTSFYNIFLFKVYLFSLRFIFYLVCFIYKIYQIRNDIEDGTRKWYRRSELHNINKNNSTNMLY